MNLTNKIETLFRALAEKSSMSNNDKYLRLWNLDTDVYGTWKLFIEKIRELGENNVLTLVEIPTDNEPRYLFKMNGINVTPTNRGEDWSKGATRQFLQEATALGFLFWDGKTFAGEHLINYALFNVINDDSLWSNIIINAMIKSCFSHSKYINRFGASMLFSMVYDLDKNIFKTFSGQILFGPTVQRNNNLGIFSNNDYSSIVKKYNDINDANTWSNLVNKLKEHISIEEAINQIYLKYIENSDDNELKSFINQDIKIIELNRKLDKLRAKLRTKIISARAKDSKTYSDIVLECDPYLDYVDAAHIYEITQIKQAKIKDIKEINCIIDEYVLKDAEDINNGLLLPLAVHRAYDKRLFEFDVNTGKVLCNVEDEDEVKSLGILNSQIKANVINDKMRDFLKKRSL